MSCHSPHPHHLSVCAAAPRPPLFHAVALVLLIAFVVAGVGCDAGQTSQLRDEVGAVQAELERAESLHAEVTESIEQMEPGEQRDDWQARADEVEQWIGVLEQTAGELHQRLDGAEDEVDGLSAVLHTAAPFLPDPWSGVAIAGGGLVLGLLRSAKVRRDGRAIADSIEQARHDGVLDLRDEEVRRKLSALQGRGGKRLVDEAQGKAAALPF